MATLFPSIDALVLEAQAQERLDEQAEILLARSYYEGNQPVFLDARRKEFLALNSSNPFCLNICRGVVDAVLDELEVIGFSAGDNDALRLWAENTWRKNEMDAGQKDLHMMSLRDREAFVIVDWHPDGYPRFTMLPAYTSTEATDSHEHNGDGLGCWVIYPDDDYKQPAEAVVKEWLEELENSGLVEQYRRRRTVYYSDRVEKFVYDGGWQHYQATDAQGNPEPWPLPWVDAQGKPLGIPVVHFYNSGLRAEHWDAIPLQDATNKLFADVLAMADASAFRVLFARGFIPTTDGMAENSDGSNRVTIKPGSVLYSTSSDAGFEAIDGQDPTAMVNALSDIITKSASITNTPLSRYIATGQVSGEQTLKGQEKPLEKKAKTRRALFGNDWKRVMSIARKLANTFGAARLDETQDITPIWETALSLDELVKKKALGVTQRKIYEEMGYTADEIEKMLNDPENVVKVSAANMAGQSFATPKAMMTNGNQPA